jgi:hypothetical protein
VNSMVIHDTTLISGRKKMKKHLSKYLLIIVCFVILHSSLIVQVEFSGDLSAVSTYVWHGIKVNSGPAKQSTAKGS